MPVTIEVNLRAVECANCGVVFGITHRFMENRKIDHQGFMCPIGHSNVYNDKNPTEKALEDLARERAAHDQTKAELNDTSKNLKKINRRISNGICPCCNRTFKNLQSHMKSKHREFVV